jgi:hypothetical protein
MEKKIQHLHSDIFFVHGSPFLLSVVTPLDHVLVESLKGRSAAILEGALTKQITAVNNEGFQITDIHFDSEGAIAKVSASIAKLGVVIHPSTSKVPIAERKIQTLKGRVRSVIMGLPFILCRTLLVMCVLFCASRLNMVPSTARANKICSMEALTGRKLDMNRDLKYGFGDYVEVPVRHTDNNVYHTRTDTAIAVASTGNANGDFKFYKPFTGSFVTRSTSSPVLPATQGLIEKLNQLAEQDGMSSAHEPSFVIGKPTGVEVVLPPEEINDDGFHDLLEPEIRDPVPVLDSSPLLTSDNPDTGTGDTTSELRGGSDDQDDSTETESPNDHDNSSSVKSSSDHDNSSPVNSSSDEYGKQNIPPNVQSRLDTRYPQRSNRTTWKDHAFISSHYTRRQAEKKFGEAALKAKMKEIMQLKDMDFAYPVNFLSLSKDQRKKIIRSHVIYQPKYDPDTSEFIKLKARFVANGSTQIHRDDVSSPTVTTHAVFINAAIAAKEKRIVKTVDLPGAYLNADMSGEEVLMHIDASEADILVLMKPEYRKFLRDDGSMIVKLTRALYGCIESAKLWYREISNTLRSIGYVQNPKDICVFNKEVQGVQCTITLHVDDLMVTSINEKLIDEVMDTLKSKYERPDAKLDVKEGNIHNYLGMTFDFTVNGKVKITMKKYVSELIIFTSIKGNAATPATEQLYIIQESELLDADKAEYFHSVVAKLLYLSKRVRPDLLTTVGFLSKRCRKPTDQDMCKLERALRYINATSELGLTLCPDKNMSIFSHIDASYAVHNDMKSQTGVAITLGNGVTYAKSSTQQLNSKSSTEAELIALTDASGHVIWVRDYLIGQGYNMGPATIYQDNMSTMALVNKGYSTSNNTRHINIRYFFIKDRVDKDEIRIEYLPTDKMIADFFTKPLQGEVFKVLRDKILGITPDAKYSFITCF